jgi:hypothetical protein
MIDFGPGAVSPMHRVNSLDYAIVLEGVFKMVLDSGEERVMQRGDIAVQRATAHQWINVTGNGLLAARMLFVLLDVNDVDVAGSKAEGFLGELAKDYAGLPGHDQNGEEVQSTAEKKAALVEHANEVANILVPNLDRYDSEF